MIVYQEFLRSKQRRDDSIGFKPIWMPDFLFDFQSHLVDWNIKLGRSATFADCGLGKTPMSLVWAENILRRENRPILIFTPLAVSKQFVREGEKFGIEVHNARDGRVVKGINVVNYQRMHYFDPDDFVAVCCDESSCLKHFDSKTRQNTTEFLCKMKYRLLGSATPAPNDYMELGTSSEALGNMSRSQMLGMFFCHRGDSTQKWELKGHARKGYWRWVASWARAIRFPSDFGYEDGDFVLPPLTVNEHLVESPGSRNGHRGFFYFARTLEEQRLEKKGSIKERCEKVASLVPKKGSVVVWCHLNQEGDLLEKIIPDAVQVAGKHHDDLKEERLFAFANGQIRVLVTKPKIAAFGMNWQHCSKLFCFPSDSYEQYYQLVRRCWRFGQTNPVEVNLVATTAEEPIMKTMLRKERQGVAMFAGIIREMHNYQVNAKVEMDGEDVEVPRWL